MFRFMLPAWGHHLADVFATLIRICVGLKHAHVSVGRGSSSTFGSFATTNCGAFEIHDIVAIFIF